MLGSLGRLVSGLCGRSGTHSALDGFIAAEVDAQHESLALGQVETTTLVVADLTRQLRLAATAWEQMDPDDQRRVMLANQLMLLDQQLRDSEVRLEQWSTALQTVQSWNSAVGHTAEIRKAIEFTREFKSSSMRSDAPDIQDLQSMQQMTDDLAAMKAAVATQQLTGNRIIFSGADTTAAIASSAANSSAILAPPGAGSVAMGGGAAAARSAGHRSANDIVAALRARTGGGAPGRAPLQPPAAPLKPAATAAVADSRSRTTAKAYA